jgi:hypothetical protein
MKSGRDDYDVFLDSWEPGAILTYATLSPNLNDPVARQRMLDDSTGRADLPRSAYTPGIKLIAPPERALRGWEFFEAHHFEWSTHFRDRVENADIDADKLDLFIQSFSTLWVDGRSRRQDTPEMMGIKAAIREHDRAYHLRHAGRFVLAPVDDDIAPTFTPTEMAAIFEANASLLDVLIPDYLDHLGNNGPTSINEIYVRRGVYMPSVSELRTELHYLSSYSFALGPVEQFAQTWTNATRDAGVPSIFSAPLPAVQKRVVAFAPFIAGMDLRQLELVVAPPIEPTPLRCLGEHGGIHEFEFQ